MVESETLIVQFRSPIHRTYHQVLMEFGFSFMVGTDMLIGVEYKHPKKELRVRLSEDIDKGDLDYVSIGPDNKSYADSDFTETENKWVYGGMSGPEILARELYILLRIRPKSLNTMPPSDRLLK